MTAEELRQQELLPIPDPSALTTAALDREVANLHEKIDDAIKGIARELHTAIAHRGDLMDSELKSLDKQLKMIEEHRQEQKADTTKAVEAALIASEKSFKENATASEKAIDKTEKNTAEAIKALNATIAASIGSVHGSLSDLKERVGSLDTRLTAGEAAKNGNPLKERVVAVESRATGAKDNTAALIAGVGMVISIIGILVILFHAFGG